MQLSPDLLDLLRELSNADVRFMIVGAYAVGFHGRPRATKDLDVWIEPSDENAPRVMRALRAFGAPVASMGVTEGELSVPGVWITLGVEPARIDLLTKLTGLTFADAWPRRAETLFGGTRCSVIGFDDLLTAKRAAGRPQDIADVVALERLAKLKNP
jgi:predicted nucleotidyltransferase